MGNYANKLSNKIKDNWKRIACPLAVVGIVAPALTACNDDATIASHNLSKAADNFEIARRIVFYNGITDKYMFSIEGYCSIKADGVDKQLEVTCKNGQGGYEKHFLGLSDNVSYIAEQLKGADVSLNHARVTFKPQSIIPDVDLRGDVKDLAPRPQ